MTFQEVKEEVNKRYNQAVTNLKFAQNNRSWDRYLIALEHGRVDAFGHIDLLLKKYVKE